jgi:hypothetical protein
MFALDGDRKCFYSVLLAPSTPADDVAMFEEILTECTSFELAGAISKQSTEEMVQEVADDVVADEEIIVTEGEQPGQLAQPSGRPTTSGRIMAAGASVQGAILASANWASQKILEQSQSYQSKTEPCKKTRQHFS